MTQEALNERKRKHTAGISGENRLPCRAGKVHSLRGIAPLNPSEAESVAVRRLFVRKSENKVIAYAQKQLGTRDFSRRELPVSAALLFAEMRPAAAMRISLRQADALLSCGCQGSRHMGGFRYLFRYRNGIGSQKYSGADAGRERRFHVAPLVAEHEGLCRINA